MFFVWGVVIIASAFLAGIERAVRYSGSNTGNVFLRMLEGLSITIYIAVLAALLVTTILIVIMRFYKGLLGDEGYLIHTLPVAKGQIIFAKGIMATAITALSVIVATISFLIVFSAINPFSLSDTISSLKVAVTEQPKLVLVAFEIFVLIVLGVLFDIYKIYASIAIGQISDKHRVLSSFGAYFAINTALYILCISAINFFGDKEIFDFAVTNESMSGWGQLQFWMLIFAAIELAIIAILHVITEQLLRKKLNL